MRILLFFARKMDSTNDTITWREFLIEILKFTVMALVIVIPVRLYVAQPFIVSGSSMDPTFYDGEYLIVDELSYRFSAPERGDVIIFRYPLEPKKFYIKRLIGLPGETVQITNGVVTITKPTGESFVLDQPYVKLTRNDSENRTLGADEYFVMGDNRAASSDSRSWGPINRKHIVGKAFLRLFPVTDISVFPGEVTYDK